MTKKPDSSSKYTAQQGPRFDADPLLKNSGKIRDDFYCTECSKQIVAMLDGTLNGNHKLRCPHCRHFHFRVIKDGKVTEQRYDHSEPEWDVAPIDVWENATQPVQTTSAARFMRDLWLNRSRDDT